MATTCAVARIDLSAEQDRIDQTIAGWQAVGHSAELSAEVDRLRTEAQRALDKLYNAIT